MIKAMTAKGCKKKQYLQHNGSKEGKNNITNKNNFKTIGKSFYNLKPQVNIDPSLLTAKNIKAIKGIPYKLISNAIKTLQTKENKLENIAEWENQIAPPREIIEDLETTIKKTSMMFIGKEMSYIFDIKAIEGHAQNGQGTFPQIYQNTTTKNVLKAIEEEGPNQLKKQFSQRRFQNLTQKYINSIVEFMEEWVKDAENNISKLETKSNSTKFKNNRKRTLNGMSCFKGMEMDMLELMRGFYLTSNMDTLQPIRKDGYLKYGYKIGGGEYHLTAQKELQELGINIRDLSGIHYNGSLRILNELPTHTRLKILNDLGVTKDKTLPLEDIAQGEYTWKKIMLHKNVTDLSKNTKYKGEYIKDEKGYGVGDDMVIFLAGFLPPSIYNEKYKESSIAIQSRIIGALLGDMIDTMEKDSKLFIPGGQDMIAGLHLNGLYKKLCQDTRFRRRFNLKEQPNNNYNLVSHEELVDFTMAGANTATENIHSSQRWFYMNKGGTCAISEYLKHAYFYSKITSKEMFLSDIKNFKINPDINHDQTKFTYQQTPLHKIKTTLNKRLYLISNQEKREKRIMKYFSKN